MLKVIKFGADWCGPCKMIAPTIKKLQEKYNVENSQVEVLDVNVDENHELAAEYQIRGIPTIIFLKEGQLIDKKVGVLKEKQIEEIIAQNL